MQADKASDIISHLQISRYEPIPQHASQQSYHEGHTTHERHCRRAIQPRFTQPAD